jgi:hypothetical protein
VGRDSTIINIDFFRVAVLLRLSRPPRNLDIVSRLSCGSTLSVLSLCPPARRGANVPTIGAYALDHLSDREIRSRHPTQDICSATSVRAVRER